MLSSVHVGDTVSDSYLALTLSVTTVLHGQVILMSSVRCSTSQATYSAAALRTAHSTSTKKLLHQLPMLHRALYRSV